MKKKLLPLLFLAAALSILIYVSSSVSTLSESREAAAKQHLEDAIRKAAVACYSAEGAFPPNLDYIQTHYGLRYDPSQFLVHYELFASNLMPDITVMEK